MIDRRTLIASAGAATALAGSVGEVSGKTASRVAGSGFKPLQGARFRMVYVNDLSGDIDGLFSAVHAVLSTSIDLRAIVGTATGEPGETAQKSAELAREMLRLMGMAGAIPVHVGAEAKLESADRPADSPGIQAIVAEALREDTKLPLFVAVGGGLTEVASALIRRPEIAGKLTLVWIGGIGRDRENAFEYNFNIDPVAAEHVFNESAVPIWQIPSEAYATCLVSAAEIEDRVAPCGAIGRWLYQKLFEGAGKLARYKINTGETWTLGDSPLVLVTALSTWVPGQQGSNLYDEVPAPRVDRRGRMQARTDGRKIRVYRSLDTRIMLSDFFSKLRLHAGRSRG